MKAMNKQIKMSTIAKIQRCTMRIFEAQDEDYPDNRVVVSNERAIQHYLADITSDTNEQCKILNAIESENFNTKDYTFKPICDNLRQLGYEIVEGK